MVTKKAFTLLEVIITIVILLAMTAVVLPQSSKIIYKSQLSEAINFAGVVMNAQQQLANRGVGLNTDPSAPINEIDNVAINDFGTQFGVSTFIESDLFE